VNPIAFTLALAASLALARAQTNPASASYEPPLPPGLMRSNAVAVVTTNALTVTNAPEPAIDESQFTIEPGAMTLSFDVPSRVLPLHGSIIRGPGFRVWADWQASRYGTLRFLFQQLYRGMPLNEWSGGNSFPAAFEGSVSIEMPPPDGSVFRVTVEYDLHTARVVVSNATTSLVRRVLWRDNMTDALGTDGPATAVVDHPAVTLVAFTPATPRPASRYVWEGVIGNTSHHPYGPGVHAPWWPIARMVSRGSNVFYTGGYNEGKWDVQKFDINNPQVVVTNFSASGRKQLGPPFPVDLRTLDDSTLLVKYNDSNVVAFDAATTVKLADGLPEWEAPSVLVPTNDSTAMAVHPEDPNTVAVYYASTDQVVVYTNSSSATEWGTNFVIGVAGGYATGPSVPAPTNTIEFRYNVKLSGFYYDADGTTNSDARITNAVLCFQSDGKLWVSDTLTSRMLRFDTAGLCDSWFMFVAHSYHAYVDPNDPKRVFAGHLEFEVDYTNTISSCWTLKNCWTRYANGPELERGPSTQNGLFSVVTLTNNGTPQTFALMRDPARGNRRRLVELTRHGIRPTYLQNQSPVLELDPDGSVVTLSVTPTPRTGTTAHFFRDRVVDWFGSDPLFAREPLATVPYKDNHCPIYWGSAKLRGQQLFLFYPSKNQFERDLPAVPFTGAHLGAVDVAGGTWSWLNAPTGPLNGRGNFETNCHYAGSGFAVVDADIFFVYRGEGWRGGQANQIFHYKTDGTFVGQFGTPNFVQGTLLNAPGAGSNVGNISAVKVNGVIYLYTGDEWSHGVHRWRVEP
jgi:hypothetical protein